MTDDEYRALIEQGDADVRNMREVQGHRCECGDDEACAFARERDAALAEVGRLAERLAEATRLLRAYQGADSLNSWETDVRAFLAAVDGSER